MPVENFGGTYVHVLQSGPSSVMPKNEFGNAEIAEGTEMLEAMTGFEFTHLSTISASPAFQMS